MKDTKFIFFFFMIFMVCLVFVQRLLETFLYAGTADVYLHRTGRAGGLMSGVTLKAASAKN